MVERIVVTDPSSAEVVAFLDGTDRIVGRCDKCVRPRSLVEKRVAVVVRSLLDIDEDSPSRAIHEAVSSHLRSGHRLYELDYRLVAELKPDLIVGQSVCDVCAITPRDIEVQLSPSRLAWIPIYDYSPRLYRDIPGKAKRLAWILDRKDRWERLETLFREAEEAYAGACEGFRVALIEWLDPLYHAGLWASDLLRILGVDPLVPPGSPGRRVSPRELVEYSPDIVVVAPCGFSIERTMREIHLITGSEWWKRTPSYKRGSLYAIDPSLIDGSTPRVAEALSLIAGICRERPNIVDRAVRAASVR